MARNIKLSPVGIGHNGAPVSLHSLVEGAFVSLVKGDAANRRGVQALAYVAMAQHHQDTENMFNVVAGQGTPTFASMVNKEGAAETTGMSFKAYANHLFTLYVKPADKVEKGFTSEAHDRDVQRQRSQEQNMRNGLALAAELVAGGVTHVEFDRTKSLFLVPLEMLCIRGMSPRKAGMVVPLDGLRHRIFADQGDASMAINANVAQLRRALASKAPKPATVKVETVTTNDGVAVVAPIVASNGKSGAQPTTSVDAVAAMPSFDRMAQELAAIIRSDKRAKVVIGDMPADTWNALQAIATFVLDVQEWTDETQREMTLAKLA